MLTIKNRNKLLMFIMRQQIFQIFSGFNCATSKFSIVESSTKGKKQEDDLYAFFKIWKEINSLIQMDKAKYQINIDFYLSLQQINLDFSQFKIENMCERKPWGQKEDQTLKELKQIRKIQKWSEISRIMKEQFQIFGRNGKQCRQRYHNHLDSKISKHRWNIQQQKKLLSLHNLWGNRWAAISRQLPGRTDNCVKNHFYSYFRKCIKVINSLINKNCRKRIRPLKLGIINKIILIIQSFHKDPQNFDKNLYQQAKTIKMEILGFTDSVSVTEQINSKILEELTKKVGDLNKFSRNKLFKKKKIKIQSDQSEDLNHQNFIDYIVHDAENDKLKTNSEIKCQNIITSEDVKVQNAELVRQSFHIKLQQEIQNKISQYIEVTPQKKQKQQRQKNSSYYALNSVDYLQGKNCSIPDIRDFINMDDQKQWKLYFE